MQKPRRHGLSLLEVMLAIAILGGSLAVIGELVRLGVISAIETRLQSEANILCDAKMAEFSAGVLELKPYGDTAIEEDPEWYFSANVQESPQLGLLLVSVTVGQTNVIDPLMVTINRFMPDPDYDPTETEVSQ